MDVNLPTGQDINEVSHYHFGGGRGHRKEMDKFERVERLLTILRSIGVPVWVQQEVVLEGIDTMDAFKTWAARKPEISAILVVTASIDESGEPQQLPSAHEANER